MSNRRLLSCAHEQALCGDEAYEEDADGIKREREGIVLRGPEQGFVASLPSVEEGGQDDAGGDAPGGDKFVV